MGLCMLVVMLVSAIAPLQGSDVLTLTIKNQTGEVFWITLSGGK